MGLGGDLEVEEGVQKTLALHEALGAVPILMGIGELFDSMQKGVVDGTLLGTSAIRTFKLAPILKGDKRSRRQVR